ncbi:heat shock factor protein 1 isoform X2 [Parasteatoda tepidariorum]|uniref:heat shock factor protein 1 isoform X2 n=1 Tax=Parasteatoda tepidariorum TaxID=114398 RepID=UPI00077FCEDB|nr:heat shock factor protein 1 isoform X2 [Parasteatoda tepidariorum]
MHSFEVNTSNVPAFLIKLWKLVEDPSCDDLIAWSDNGLSFIIKDQAKFASELLPQYFKHSNMASFVRQLNMYGFRKVMNYERSGLRTDNNEMEFQHSFFLREQSDLLEHIKRKIPNTRVIAEPHSKSNAKDILTDLTSIRDKQDSMDNMLMKMKQENELLWKELTNMRQKHKQQEQVIEKVIHFLVQVIRNQPVGVGIQRAARMLHDSPSYKGKASQITTVDFLRKNPECIIVQDKNSPIPVIHEVEEFEVEEPLSVETCNTASSSKTLTPVSISKNPNIISLSPAINPPRENKNSINNTNENLLETSSLSSSVECGLPLSILEPLQTSSPTVNADNNEESVLGIPLEYITASDVANAFNAASNKNIITMPAKSIIKNVISIPEKEDSSEVTTVPDGINICNVITIPDSNDISHNIKIPEDNDISNVISIPEGTDIGNVISIPEGTEISNVISIPEGSDISDIIAGANSQKVKKTCNIPETTKSDKTENSLAISDFYDPTSCLIDLKANSLDNIRSPLNVSSKRDFMDPLMSDSLNTPQVSLGEEVAPDFTLANSQKDAEMSIAEREHDYPISSVASNSTKSDNLKNTFSNHLLIVEEELNRLQDIATNSWDVDTDKLLGLFSSDGMVSNDSFVDQLTDGISIKKEPEDILDDELIQLTPQMLGVDIDELRSPFLDQLDQSDNLPDILPDKKPELLDGLEDTVDHNVILEESDVFNNGETSSPNKRRKNSKTTKGKRRKLK